MTSTRETRTPQAVVRPSAATHAAFIGSWLRVRQLGFPDSAGPRPPRPRSGGSRPAAVLAVQTTGSHDGAASPVGGDQARLVRAVSTAMAAPDRRRLITAAVGSLTGRNGRDRLFLSASPTRLDVAMNVRAPWWKRNLRRSVMSLQLGFSLGTVLRRAAGAGGRWPACAGPPYT